MNNNAKKMLFYGCYIVLVAAVFMEGRLFFNLLKTKSQVKQIAQIPPAAVISPSIPIPPKLTNKQIAEKVLDWLDKQRDERGIYFASVGCNYTQDKKKIKCDIIRKAGTSGHEGITAIWGRFKFYQKYKRLQDLEIIKKDLENYGGKNKKINLTQNDFWNCNLMYEMYQSSLFSEDEKTMIKTICFDSTYSLLQEMAMEPVNNIYQVVIKNEIPEVDVVPTLATSKQSKTKIVSNVENFASIVTYPSDFLARYYWDKNDNYLKVARGYFNKAASAYIENENKFPSKDVCGLGISSLDLYKNTSEKKFLQFATSIFEKQFKREEDLSKSIQPICGIFLQKLFEATSDFKYKDYRQKITGWIIENLFDTQGGKNNLISDESFISLNINGSIGLVKYIRDNGLIVALLVSSYE